MVSDQKRKEGREEETAEEMGKEEVEAKEKKEEQKEAPSSMEDLLVEAGTHGWRNFVVIFFCAWGTFVMPLHTVSYQFLGATPDYWCHIPQLVDANWTEEQIRNFSIPKSSTDHLGACEMLDYNYTLAAHLGYEQSVRYFGNVNTSSTAYCGKRQFDRSEPITVVSKWDLVCDRRVLYSTTQSIIFAGKLIGSFTMGYLIDLLGRRIILIWTGPLYLLLGIVTAFSPDLTLYIILKFLIALVSMAFYLGGFVLALELCSTSQRSCIGALFAVPWALGYMTVPAIAYYVRPFRYLQIATTLPALSILPNFWLLHESPRWLVLKGRFDEAIQALQRIAKWNKRNLIPRQEMRALMERIFKEQSGRRTSSDLTVRCKFVFHKLFSLWIMPRWRWKLPILFYSWISVTFVYYGVSLNPPDLRTGKYLYIFLGGLLEIPAYLLLWPATQFIGRKRSMVVLNLLCAIAIFGAVGVRFSRIGNDAHNTASTSKYVYLLVLSLTGKLAITAASQLIWMYSVEFLPTEFRGVVVGEASVFGRIGSIFSPYIIDLLGEIKEWAPAVIFGSVSVVAGILFLLLPETKNMALAESTQEHCNKTEAET